MKETDIAETIVIWLEERGWDVYQEVTGTYGIADIVAKKNDECWVVECKTTFSTAVIEQALRWDETTEYISIACPMPRRKAPRRLIRLLENHGIGFFQQTWCKEEMTSCFVTPPVRKQRRKTAPWTLHEGLKSNKAGTKSGGRWSEFKETVKKLVKYVEENPNCSIKTAVENIEHHYIKRETAVNCIRQYINNGVITSIELNGNKLLITKPEQK